MIEIKGCPFCGEKSEIWLTSQGHDCCGKYTAQYTIKCHKCGISITRESRFALKYGAVVFEANGYDECIKMWNRRIDNAAGN